jgi:shikimate kinase
MKHNATFFVAENKLNQMMKNLDMCDQGKVYYTPMRVSFETSTQVNEDYIYKIINESKNYEGMKGDWIPAIEYAGVLYIHKEITQLSDGEKILFCRDGGII